MSTPVVILAFIFILGSAVILHEFGHFIVAKMFRIRVEAFSFGLGPRLFGIKFGDTDYRVSAIPLGGYVKLGGDESNAPLEGDGAADVPAHERFDLRPRWQKFLVAIAGPVMNILTALAIPLAGAMLYGIPATPAPVVSRVVRGGAAEQAGLITGDRIVAFNGPTIRDRQRRALDLNAKVEVDLSILHGSLEVRFAERLRRVVTCDRVALLLERHGRRSGARVRRDVEQPLSRHVRLRVGLRRCHA